MIRGAGRALAVAALLAGVVLGAGPVNATPSGTAAEQAARLAAEVDSLNTQAEVASERYNALTDQLDGVANDLIRAGDRVDALTQLDATTQDDATRRISAIYKSGGSLSLYATVLDGSSPNDMVNRLRIVQQLVGDDQNQVSGLQQEVADATATQTRIDALTRQRTELEKQAGDARDAITALLASKRQALDQANAEVKRLAAEEQARAQAAAEAAAQAALATAASGPIAGLPSDVPPGNPYANAAIAAAQTKIGLPYVWGGTGPNGYDCSGLVQWAYKQAGLSIPRVANDQYTAGPEVALSAIAPGDLVFWATNPANKRTIHHVAMYVGSGQMIEAPHTGAFVRLVPLRLGPEFAGAVRPGLTVTAAPTT